MNNRQSSVVNPLVPERCSPSRRHFLAMLTGMALTGGAVPGCAAHRWHRRKKGKAGGECADGETAIPRRFFVSPQGPTGINGVAGSLGREVAAALNTQPKCSAVLLPVDFPIDAPPDAPPGPSGQLLHFIESIGPSSAIDELLIVFTTEVVAFRPMRISAILERRSIQDGTTMSREHRTWNAPQDVQPLSPSPVNRLILNHPLPLDVTENQELSRLSPLTFQQKVAVDIARELSSSPI